MFDWVQMLTATLQPNQPETRFLPPHNCISLWRVQLAFLLLHIFDIFKHILYCIILPSPQPGLYSIPGSNCIRTNTCVIQNCIITDKPHIKGPLQTLSQFPLKKTNTTWSVGRRLKSLGGFVITYLLPGASGPALLSRNLQAKYSNHCGTHFQVAKVLPNFKLPKSFQRMLLLKFIQVCWGKNPFTFVQWIFFTILWTFVAGDSIWIYCANV